MHQESRTSGGLVVRRFLYCNPSLILQASQPPLLTKSFALAMLGEGAQRKRRQQTPEARLTWCGCLVGVEITAEAR